MTKRPLNMIVVALITYIVLVISIMAIITGVSITAFSVYIFITEDGLSALTYFLVGLNLIAFGYLSNILFTYLLSGKWSWRFVSGLTLRSTSKK